MKLVIRTDGASKGNPGKSGIGIVFYKDGTLIKKISERIGLGTNNEAEYKAVIRAFEEAVKLGADEVEHYSDSEFLISQLTGKYQVKAQNIKKLFEKVLELKKNFKKISFSWIPREENELADELANEALR